MLLLLTAPPCDVAGREKGNLRVASVGLYKSYVDTMNGHYTAAHRIFSKHQHAKPKWVRYDDADFWEETVGHTNEPKCREWRRSVVVFAYATDATVGPNGKNEGSAVTVPGRNNNNKEKRGNGNAQTKRKKK